MVDNDDNRDIVDEEGLVLAWGCDGSIKGADLWQERAAIFIFEHLETRFFTKGIWRDDSRVFSCRQLFDNS
eukprot:1961966-Amphidinium_carterae.2